jgi:hypothetical protein
MTKRRSRLARTKTAATGTLRIAGGGLRAAGWAAGRTRTVTSTTMGWGFGPNKYRRQVDDVVGRLSDALNVMESVLTAQQLEIEQLRQENTMLRAARP